MKHAFGILLVATLVSCAGDPKGQAATAAICAIHAQPGTPEAVNLLAGLSPEEIAKKKAALDILCAFQATTTTPK